MSTLAERLRAALAATLLGLAVATVQAQTASAPAFPGIGRAALPAEVAAWDTDVRPDFKGLPAGSGTVAQGMVVWEGKCESCHGIFGESNSVFTPLIGGTTAADVRSGRAARLTDEGFPGRTTLMKLATLSTLWDYIYRAMPWNAPRSLSVDETYAVTAYMLNLGRIVPDDFSLSHRNMAQTQALLPNRKGMSTDHGMWPGRSLGNGGRADVRAAAGMKDCAVPAKVTSFLPEHARCSRQPGPAAAAGGRAARHGHHACGCCNAVGRGGHRPRGSRAGAGAAAQLLDLPWRGQPRRRALVERSGTQVRRPR